MSFQLRIYLSKLISRIAFRNTIIKYHINHDNLWQLLTLKKMTF